MHYDNSFIILLLYVDDMLIACNDMSKINELKSPLGKEFYMKDPGAATKMLSMGIRRDKKVGKLWLS